MAPPVPGLGSTRQQRLPIGPALEVAEACLALAVNLGGSRRGELPPKGPRRRAGSTVRANGQQDSARRSKTNAPLPRSANLASGGLLCPCLPAAGRRGVGAENRP